MSQPFTSATSLAPESACLVVCAARSGGSWLTERYRWSTNTRRETPRESLVPKGGLEPPRVAPHAPQTCASANSATSARRRQSMPLSRAACQSTAEPEHPSHRGLAQPRVERVPYPFPEEVVGEHGDEDGQPRIESQPPGVGDELLAVVEDIAPGR